MAITRKAAVSATATSVTFGYTAVAGDLILVFAYSSSTTIPTLAAGYTDISNTAGTQQAARCAYKIATGGETSTTGWTNATSVVCMIYQAGNGIMLGATSAPIAAGSSTSVTMSPLTFQDTTGNSWLVSFGGAKSATTWASAWDVSTRQTFVATAAGYDDPNATGFGGAGCVISPTSRWHSITLEVREIPPYPYFVAAGTVASGTAAITPALPAGVQVNDILIALVQTSNQAIAASAGWTELDDQTRMAAGTAATAGALRLGVFWRRATGSDSAPTLGSGVYNHIIGQVLSFRNCITTGNPWDVVGTGNRPTNSSASTFGPGETAQWVNGISRTVAYDFTTTVPNTLVLHIAAHALDQAAPCCSPGQAGFLTGWGEFTDQSTATGTGGGFGVAGGVKATAGDAQNGSNLPTSVTSVNWQGAVTQSGHGLMLLALKPPSTGPAAYTMPIAQGSFALTGQAVPTIWGQRAVALPAGSFAMTGQAVTMPKGKAMPLVNGDYRLTSPVGGGAVPTDNLISYWKLDEASGTRYDAFGTNHLTDNAGVASVSGVQGNGAYFNRSLGAQYLWCASNPSLQMAGNTSFTIAAWINVVFPDDMCLVTKDSSAGASRDYTLDLFWTGGGNGFRFYTQGGGGGPSLVVVGSNPSLSTWYFLVAWYDSALGQLFLRINNAAPFGSATGNTGTDVSNAEFRIGARQYVGVEGYAVAVVDEVGLWKRVLTTTEHTALWNGGAGVTFGGGGTTFRRSRMATLTFGPYALTGQTTGLKRARITPMAQGSYAATGQPVALNRGKLMALAQAGYTLAGQAANLIRKRIAPVPQGGYSLAGQAANLLKGRRVIITQGGYTLTGIAATLLRTRTMPIPQAGYTLGGQIVNLLRARRMPAAQAGYAWTGFAVGLAKAVPARILTVTAGAFTLAGQAATLLRTRLVGLLQGGYTVAGQAMAMKPGRGMGIPQGTYTAAGQQIGLRRTRQMTAAQAGFTLAGQPAGLRIGHRIANVAGAYALAGQATNLRRGRLVGITQGIYLLTGQAATFPRARRIVVVPGAYLWSGQPVNLKAGRRVDATQGLYAWTGIDILLHSSGGESWIFYAGQVTGSAVKATGAGSILSVTGAGATLLAKIPGLAEGEPVIACPDSSGHGFYAAGATTRQPLFKRNILNNRAVMRFDGADDLLVTVNAATAGITGAATIFIVQKTRVVQSSCALMAWQTSPDQRIGIHLPWSDGNIYWDFGDAAGGSGRVSVAWGGNTTDFFVWTFRAGGGVQEIWRNGALIYGTGGKLTSFLAAGLVPFQIGGASGIAYQNSDMAEVIIFNVAVPDTNRAGAEKFLADYYGLSVAGGTATDPGTIAGLQTRWKADSMLGGILNAATGSTLAATPGSTTSALAISVAQSLLKVEKTE